MKQNSPGKIKIYSKYSKVKPFSDNKKIHLILSKVIYVLDIS